MTMRRYIAQRIRLLRVLKRRTIQQFADDLGVTRAAVIAWEAAGDMSLDRLDQIAARYGIASTDWFLPPRRLKLASVTITVPINERGMSLAILRGWKDLLKDTRPCP